VDSAGNVYVAAQGDHTIRKLAPGGVVTTLAGLAGSPGSANGAGSAARFHNPTRVALDSAGNVYVADSYNHTIRKVTPAGVVTTLAGVAGGAGSVDGTGAGAQFWTPMGVAVDSADNVFVAERDNCTIRRITPGGVVTTVAGLAGNTGSADGRGSAVRFYYPFAVAVDNAGIVFVADGWNHTIRMGHLAVPPSIVAPPQTQTAETGSTPVFAVDVTNAAPGITYQWYFNAFSALARGTNSYLFLTNVQPTQGGLTGWSSRIWMGRRPARSRGCA